MIRPAALRHGARVALVAPAGPLPDGAIERGVERVRRLGWEPVVGRHARGRTGYLSGTDDERLSDLNGALESPHIDAIWCLRGGYGTMRILERITWEALVDRPRPLIGFSDNTALHLAAMRAGVGSFHGPHPAVEDLPEHSLDLLRSLVTSREPIGALPFPPGSPGRGITVVGGVTEGPLLGGNLSLLAALCGTACAPIAAGTILFLEEVGEPAYRVDRLLSQLLLAGVLDRVGGIAIGAFSEAPDAGAAGIPTPLEVLRERLGGLGVPIAAGFPFGHVPDHWTLPLGVQARLDADAGTLALLEPAVA